jgi:hypothetical protein
MSSGLFPSFATKRLSTSSALDAPFGTAARTGRRARYFVQPVEPTAAAICGLGFPMLLDWTLRASPHSRWEAPPWLGPRTLDEDIRRSPPKGPKASTFAAEGWMLPSPCRLLPAPNVRPREQSNARVCHDAMRCAPSACKGGSGQFSEWTARQCDGKRAGRQEMVARHST